MASLPWFRFYSEALTDRKIARVCRLTQQPRALVLGVWVTLLCLANESDERGTLMMGEGLWLKDEEIAAETGLDPVTFGRIADAFRDLNMISIMDGRWELPNWDKRQFPSDNSTARVQAHRARKRAERSTKRGETFQERSRNVIEENREEEKREEENAPDGAAHPSSFYELQAAICQATRLQPLMLKPWAIKDIEAMFAAGIEPADVEKAAEYFKAEDWRGKKGDPLTLRILGDIVGHAKEWDRRPQTAKRDLWATLRPLIAQYGRRNKPDLPPDLEAAVHKAGGWSALCQMSEHDARAKLQAVSA